MRGHRAAAIFAAALACGPRIARAQTGATTGPLPIDSVALGDKVRVRVSNESVVRGMFHGIRADSLLLAPCYHCATSKTVPLPAIRELDIARHAGLRGSAVLTYAAVGTLIGFGTGAIVGAIAAEQQTRSSRCSDLCGLSWLAVPYLATIGGGSGLVVGAGVGLIHRDQYWVRVELPVMTR